MNGTFLGFEVLKDQMNVCPFNYDSVNNMLRFGTVTESYCSFDLTQLITGGSLPDNANYFFDLFVQDSSGNLIDVPIIITNFIDSTSKTPNTGSAFSNSWRLVRRFMMYDTISSTNNGIATYVRWASSIKFKITLDLNS